MMKEGLATVWIPVKGVSIREIISNTFLFQFFHKLGFTKVYNEGPWNFDGNFSYFISLWLVRYHYKSRCFMISFGSKSMIYQWDV